METEERGARAHPLASDTLDCIRRHGGIVVTSSDEGGTPFVLDRLASRALQVGSHEAQPYLSDAIAAFLDDAGDADPGVTSKSVTAEISVLAEACGVETDMAAVQATVAAMTETHRVRLRFHFPDPLTPLEPVVEAIESLRRIDQPKGKILISLIGPFDRIDDELMDRLMKQGVLVQVVNGWWARSSDEDHTEVRRDAMRKLSRFGFVCPALWYVHSGNINELPRLIEQSIVANQYSGFAAPGIWQDPYANLSSIHDLLPGPDAYVTELVELAAKHNAHDSTFMPLNELVVRTVQGGWDLAEDAPSHMRVIFRGDGNSGCFRQVPSLSREWATCHEINGMQRDDILRNLLSRQHEYYSWPKNEYCNGCQWRFVCGGLDPTAPDAPHDSEMPLRDIVCQHRMFFLEAFVSLRINLRSIPIYGGSTGEVGKLEGDRV